MKRIAQQHFLAVVKETHFSPGEWEKVQIYSSQKNRLKRKGKKQEAEQRGDS